MSNSLPDKKLNSFFICTGIFSIIFVIRGLESTFLPLILQSINSEYEYDITSDYANLAISTISLVAFAILMCIAMFRKKLDYAVMAFIIDASANLVYYCCVYPIEIVALKLEMDNSWVSVLSSVFSGFTAILLDLGIVFFIEGVNKNYNIEDLSRKTTDDKNLKKYLAISSYLIFSILVIKIVAPILFAFIGGSSIFGDLVDNIFGMVVIFLGLAILLKKPVFLFVYSGIRLGVYLLFFLSSLVMSVIALTSDSASAFSSIEYMFGFRMNFAGNMMNFFLLLSLFYIVNDGKLSVKKKKAPKLYPQPQVVYVQQTVYVQQATNVPQPEQHKNDTNLTEQNHNN